MRRLVVALAAAVLAVPGTASCTSGGSSGGRTLTYWASNQAPSPEIDKQVLRPELDKFERRTGFHVDLEVIPWADLLNRILAAAVSGRGPDVVNIGNTWSASLQATKALLPFVSHTVRDGRLITGQNPGSARATAKAVARCLSTQPQSRTP